MHTSSWCYVAERIVLAYCSWWVVLVPVVAVILITSIIAGALARSRRGKPAQAVNPSAYAGQTAYPVQPGTNYANYGPAYYNGLGSTGMLHSTWHCASCARADDARDVGKS